MLAVVRRGNAGPAGACRLLLGRGADIECANEIGFTPLMAALQGGHDDIVKMLLEAGAQVDPDVECKVDAPGFGRQTPLGVAVGTANMAAVKTLLKAGANVDSPAGNGWTPLKRASYAGNADIVKLLLRPAQMPTSLTSRTTHR